jgi:predicted transcriptional regulator
MSDQPGIDPAVLGLPSLRAAFAERDISRVYKILVREGIPQHTIAELTGQSRPEVSEIIKGRQVQSLRRVSTHRERVRNPSRSHGSGIR